MPSRGSRSIHRLRREGTMKIRLKPLTEQVAVVLGASSGIGRASALRLARRGATVVVAARNEPALQSLVSEIVSEGGTACAVPCDVADHAQVVRVVDVAISTYGRIDTWVNCAVQSVFAAFWDTSPEEFRRLMEVGYLGQVHGALAAVPALRAAGQGALISISCREHHRPAAARRLQRREARRGAMEGLRRDLLSEDIPISVTSVKPGTIDTPLFTNSRNKLPRKPKGPPPIYTPESVAACVEYAAEHPVRDLFAGGAAKQLAVGEFIAPRLMDRLMSKVMIKAVTTAEPAPDPAPGNLDAPSGNDRVDGELSGRPSGYTWWQVHPGARRAALTGVAAVGAGAVTILRRR
jgi:NAD(P)-dependent dehydrogenase (short-subunit alcohol dehydrogenase family)